MSLQLEPSDPIEPTGRAVCENVDCGWSTAYHGQIKTPGHPIWWGRMWGPDNRRDAQCPKCLKGALVFQPLEPA